MASPKGRVGKMVGGFVATQAVQFAKDPEVRKFVADAAKPLVSEAPKMAKQAVGKVKLPQRMDPFGRLEDDLDTIEGLIDRQELRSSDEQDVTRWRDQLASLRAAIPLARVDQGKGRRQKLKDLQAREKTLLDEVYGRVVGE